LIKVANIADFAESDIMAVSVSDISIGLFRTDDGVFALEDKCSHADWPLTKGRLRDDAIECRLHRAKFCLRTGAPRCLPATEPVRTFPVSVKDGSIFITLPDQSAEEDAHG